MKIKHIEIFPVHSPGRTLVPLMLETEDGQYGVGECGLQRRVEGLRGVLEHLKPILIGMDPRRIEHIWQTVFRGGFYPADRIVGSVLAGIDMALWDLKGKALGVPVQELFGGRSRDRVYVYTHTETVYKESAAIERSIAANPYSEKANLPDAMGRRPPDETVVEPLDHHMIDIPKTIEKAREYFAAGWRFWRTAPPSQGILFEPRPSLISLLELIAAMRSQLGNEFELMVDVHARLNPADAIWFCREVEQFRPYFVEDPLRAEYIDGYHHLRQHVNVPLAVGEQFCSKWEFRELIENDLIDFARIDLAIACGLTEGRKIAGWCEVHHIGIAPHNPLGPINLAAGLHLNTAMPNGAVQEMPWKPGVQLPEIFTTTLELEGGALKAPTAPGLGVTFDPDKARKHGYHMTEPPHYHRLDGSFTNC